MKIIVYYYMGGGGGLSNIILLLRAMARCHPEDLIEILSSPSAPLDALQDLPTIRIRRLAVTGHQEIDRLLLGIFQLPRIARQARADILWSINLGPYVKVGVPSVLSIHNSYQVYPWKVSRYHPGSSWHLATLRWFFRRSLRVSDAVVVQTPIMGDLVRRIPGAPQRICVAPKAVEREAEVPREPLPPPLQAALERGLGRGAFTFLFVSTWNPHKNHVTLIRAFSELARRGVRARVVLTVKPEELSATGWPEVSSLVEGGYVIPAGWVAKPHLRSLYSACDACLMPSVLESLSSAHIEAMQWGKPQITADLPYAHDLCGPAALYASPEDPHAWARQIETLMGDESIRSELVRAGHQQMARLPASWDDASETVHQFLTSVCREVMAQPGATTRRPRPPHGQTKD